MSAQVDPALVALLAEHRLRMPGPRDFPTMWRCACGVEFYSGWVAESQHATHLASVVAEYVEARGREAGARARAAGLDPLDWEPGRWWRAVAPDGSLWCESSDEDEVRELARPSDRIERLWRTVQRNEWRAYRMEPTTQEDDRG